MKAEEPSHRQLAEEAFMRAGQHAEGSQARNHELASAQRHRDLAILDALEAIVAKLGAGDE